MRPLVMILSVATALSFGCAVFKGEAKSVSKTANGGEIELVGRADVARDEARKLMEKHCSSQGYTIMDEPRRDGRHFYVYNCGQHALPQQQNAGRERPCLKAGAMAEHWDRCCNLSRDGETIVGRGFRCG